jgi:hypothetical protein
MEEEVGQFMDALDLSARRSSLNPGVIQIGRSSIPTPTLEADASPTSSPTLSDPSSTSDPAQKELDMSKQSDPPGILVTEPLPKPPPTKPSVRRFSWPKLVLTIVVLGSAVAVYLLLHR